MPTLSSLYQGATAHLAGFATSLMGWRPAPCDFPFADSDIARLHQVTAQPGSACLDEQTWNDLLLPAYLRQLGAGVSIFGRQLLYRRLHTGLDDAQVAALDTRLQALESMSTEELDTALRPLREADTQVVDALWTDTPPVPPAWWGQVWLLSLAVPVALAAVMLSPLAWLGVGAALYGLIALQMRYHDAVQEWKRSLDTIQHLLRATSLLAATGSSFAAGLDGARAGRLNRSLSRSFLARFSPDGGAYGDWFMLANVKHYFRSTALVFQERAFLRACFLHCAELEADLALTRHLRASPTWCRAQRVPVGSLAIEGGVHPLLASPAGLSLALDGKGAFISGPNGSGKSTFLRMLGLNLVTARAFGFCYARRAALPALPVYASMQNEDSLLDGQSLYMTELARARSLLETVEGPHPGICLIDEIFRGTNHLESVSASAAVLDTLAARVPVIVSSHNLVLGSLLAHRLAPYRIERGDGDTPTLVPGVLTQTNGIALLKARGFGAEIEEKAQRVAAWLAGYLGQPEAGARLLCPDRAQQPHDGAVSPYGRENSTLTLPSTAESSM